MMHSLRIIPILFLIVLVLGMVPTGAQAVQWWPLVPCGLNQQPTGVGTSVNDYTKPCNQCDLLKLLKNIIDFIFFAITPILATLFFVIAGLRMIWSGAKPSELGEAKKMFSQTILGLLVLSLAWLATNTLLKSFARDDISDKWWELQCKAVVRTPFPTPSEPPTGTCTDLPALAATNNVPFPKRNSPALEQLIQCVQSNPSVASLLDTQQIYTFERSRDACNYTRGQSTCGSCAHSAFSCHYGGRTGTQGSEGVDFNSTGSEQELFNRINALRSQCGFGFIQFESDHTHVSTQACDGN